MSTEGETTASVADADEEAAVDNADATTWVDGEDEAAAAAEIDAAAHAPRVDGSDVDVDDEVVEPEMAAAAGTATATEAAAVDAATGEDGADAAMPPASLPPPPPPPPPSPPPTALTGQELQELLLKYRALPAIPHSHHGTRTDFGSGAPTTFGGSTLPPPYLTTSTYNPYPNSTTLALMHIGVGKIHLRVINSFSSPEQKVP